MASVSLWEPRWFESRYVDDYEYRHLAQLLWQAYLGSIRGAASTAMVASAALGPLPFGYVVTLSGSYNTVS